ncbi:hypothetical protein QTP88_024116 [Uroleucon formosanum]
MEGDLFQATADYALGHCVSKDFKMSEGIALEFRRKFGQVDQLLQQNKQVMEISAIKCNERNILYMITKDSHQQKSTYETIFYALKNLREYCESNNINKVALPKVGSGYDKLNWEQIHTMLRYIFKNSEIKIMIYSGESYSDEEKHRIIEEFHLSPLGGHQGISRTIKRIKLHHTWKGLKKDVIEFIKKSIPLVNHTANSIAKAFVENFVCHHGIPESIVTDQGQDFLSKIFTACRKVLQIDKIKTTAYHPQSNSALERSHRTLAEYLRHFVDEKKQNWDQYLPYSMFVYNSSVHSTTGFQPYELVYDRQLEGKLHPLVISSAQLLEEMKIIKLNLPSNLDIPVKLDLSDMIKYLALTIDQEYYVNLDQNEFSMCYDTKHFKVCKNLVTQRVTTSDDCEINLITNANLASL